MQRTKLFCLATSMYLDKTNRKTRTRPLHKHNRLCSTRLKGKTGVRRGAKLKSTATPECAGMTKNERRMRLICNATSFDCDEYRARRTHTQEEKGRRRSLMLVEVERGICTPRRLPLVRERRKTTTFYVKTECCDLRP